MRIFGMPLRSEDFKENTLKLLSIENPADTSTAPCEGCHSYQECINERMACPDFRNYMGQSNYKTEPNRDPSQKIYRQIFGAV